MKPTPITSLFDLNYKCSIQNNETPIYQALAMSGARNLGGNPRDYKDAIQWLLTTANETSETGVVDEINFLID